MPLYWGRSASFVAVAVNGPPTRREPMLFTATFSTGIVYYFRFVRNQGISSQSKFRLSPLYLIQTNDSLSENLCEP